VGVRRALSPFKVMLVTLQPFYLWMRAHMHGRKRRQMGLKRGMVFSCSSHHRGYVCLLARGWKDRKNKHRRRQLPVVRRCAFFSAPRPPPSFGEESERERERRQLTSFHERTATVNRTSRRNLNNRKKDETSANCQSAKVKEEFYVFRCKDSWKAVTNCIRRNSECPNANEFPVDINHL